MTIIPIAVIVARGIIETDGALVNGRGIAGVVRNGAGDYWITLTVAIPESDFLPPLLTLEGPTPGFISHVRTSDTVHRVLTAQGASVATDREFGFVMLRAA